MNSIRRPLQAAFCIIFAIAAFLIWTHREAAEDWLATRTYHTPTTISQLAAADTMTPEARRLFYVNRPALEGKTAFNAHCPNDAAEQSVVLGCFHGDRQGIFLYSVNDPQLDGVEQVTAAHEMLHQAYQRLSGAERTRVNALLQQVLAGTTSAALRSQVALYKQTEPSQINDELHSLIGTEISDLPASLETYYSQYFAKRANVVAYYNRYAAAFSQRQTQIAQYDGQLAAIKSQIDGDKSSLDQQLAALEQQRAQLDDLRASGQTAAYNAAISAYNQKVGAYNQLLASAQQLITQYNEIVDQRNAIAVQEQHLEQQLNSRAP